MATRTNCIEYVGTNRTATLSATTVEEQSITVDIPETDSRAFVSVFMEVYCSENNASTSSRGSMTARMLGVGIDAVADSDVTVTDTITDGNDQASFVFKRDITSYFTTNYTGSSHTVGLRFSFTQSGANALTVNNVSMRVIITYTYDDASEDTRIKTVRIPFQSKLGALATSEDEITGNGLSSSGGGSSQIPDLSSFLPEASKTYKDIFFDIEWNDAFQTATTDQVISLKTASDATYNPGTYEKANTTGVRHHLFWKRTDLATNAVQAFKMWATSAAHNHPVVVLVVTYTYDHSSSNDQIASFMVPLRFKAPKYFGGSTEPALLVAEFWVPEPSTVTLKHSAVILHFADFSTPSGYNLRAGSGSYTTYTLGTVNANTAGTQCLVHRVDSGGIGGLTLARGRVELTVNEYHGTAAHWSAGYLLVNYTHGKHASGSGVCNHTIKRLARGDAIQAAAVSISSQAEAIPEAAYWVNGYGLRLAYSQQSSVVVQGLLEAQRTTGDVPDVGAEMLLFTSRIGGGNTASDFAISEFVTAPAVAFNRFASDDEHLLDVERARTWRFYNPATTAINLQLETWLTYHAITFSKTSAITGSGGGTVNWRLCYNGASSYLLAPGEKVASGTRSGNGNVSLTWYDDTESMFVEAYEDSTHVGRSFNFTMA